MIAGLNPLRRSPSFVYLSSTYKSHEGGIHAAFREACKLTARLIREGVPVFSPIAHTHYVGLLGGIDAHDYDVWIPADAPLMASASDLVVATTSGWKFSRGIGIEIEVFEKARRPIWLLDPETLDLRVAPGPTIPDRGHYVGLDR